MGKVRKKLKVHIKVKGDITRALTVGSVLDCADNTGVKKLQVITVKSIHGTKNRNVCAGISDLVICSAIEGTPEVKKHVFPAVIVRQKKEFRRPNGERIKFYDNAAVVVTPEGDLKGTEIKGAVAREAIQRWSSLAAAAKIVI